MTDDAGAGRRERRAAETRAAIASAARQLFEERGFTETTVDEIAARADVAQRTFFRYFATKEAVLFADYEELHTRLLEAVRDRPIGEPPLRALLAALLEHCGVVEERLERLSWAMHHAEECGGAGVEPALLKARTTSEVAGVLAERSGLDPVLDPRPTAWAGMALACFGAAVRSVVHRGGHIRSRFWGLVTTLHEELGHAVADLGPEAPAPPAAAPLAPAPLAAQAAPGTGGR